MSMKSLQDRLKELEKAGMLKRIKYEGSVPKVEHHITERGEKLLKIMLAIKELAGESENCICPIEAHINREPIEETSCPNRKESI